MLTEEERDEIRGDAEVAGRGNVFAEYCIQLLNDLDKKDKVLDELRSCLTLDDTYYKALHQLQDENLKFHQDLKQLDEERNQLINHLISEIGVIAEQSTEPELAGVKDPQGLDRDDMILHARTVVESYGKRD